jgi:Ca2+-transporting ATPase
MSLNTQEEMHLLHNSRHGTLLLALALSNDVHQGETGDPTGDPTEVALFQKALDLGVGKEKAAALFPRVGEIPFSSERQAMTTVHRTPSGEYLSFTKGGFEAITSQCREFESLAGQKHLERLAADGLRVLAYGFRTWDTMPADLTPTVVERELTFLGMSGALDPPRPEAAAAVQTCQAAGIQPVMITGDHPLTAANIALRLGIITSRDARIVTGQELATIPHQDLLTIAGQARVYARVAPEQKLRLVAVLQEQGEAVAMTGDGVNDAPALKKADIGIAMGINGTDVAKEASGMVLLDDNFATIVRAVGEGRKIYDNIRKFVKYTLTSNAGEIWTIFLAPFLGMPIPLLPIHILWINLITGARCHAAAAPAAGRESVCQGPVAADSVDRLADGWYLSADLEDCAAQRLALADHGIHGTVPVATRPFAGDPLRPRFSFSARDFLQSVSSLDRGCQHRSADGDNLCSVPAENISY